MNEELEFETYLSISQNQIAIYLFDIKNVKNLYEEKIVFENYNNNLDLNNLTKFLDKNIFKIEKLVGKFIKNIFLVIEDKNVLNLFIGIKRKNYEEIINQKFLENILTDAKDLFKENYPNKKIMHIIINRYLVDENNYLFFKENLRGDDFCLEIEFKSISKNIIYDLDKILEKFQIKIVEYLDGNYIKNFNKNKELEFSTMIYKIRYGINENEVKLIPKNLQKKGFFEKFFQLFG